MASPAILVTMPRIAFITPPIIKPCEPGLSAPAAAAWFRAHGVDAYAIDGSIGWYRHALAPARLAGVLETLTSPPPAYRLALKDVAAQPLRRPETYASRRVYSSATSHLANALKLASEAHAGFGLRVADVVAEGRRPHASADLEAVARQPGPFDAYFLDVLLPHLEAEGTTHVAISLAFLNQAYATFRLARLLEANLPHIHRVLGGPLPACWSAAGARMAMPPFTAFHQVVPGTTESEMVALALAWGGHEVAEPPMLAADLGSVDWDAYLAPMPIVPAALGQGCYWRRCTFCPDHLHPAYHPSRRGVLAAWLHQVAERFPQGAMLHLTDSALAPHQLAQVADVVTRDHLPIRWHGFVRMEARFADPAFAARLAKGGCAMLQWGLETASPRLLGMLDKGIDVNQARGVMQASGEAGIRNHAYLLFGLPTETDGDRDATLAFLEATRPSLHDLNVSLLNLPRRSPMHAHPARFGITELLPFGEDADLSLYDDFRCGASHPRLEARRWLSRAFFKAPTIKGLLGDLNAPFKANHGCFLSPVHDFGLSL